MLPSKNDLSMTSPLQSESSYEAVRQLAPCFAAFARCRSGAELRALPAYREVAATVDEALATVDTGDFRGGGSAAGPSCRVVAWNIERGLNLAGQVEAMRADPYLREADIVLLVESDVGMARSGNVDVGRTMARELGMAYAFAPCYLSMVKGSGLEYDIAGENELGLHGNAVLSLYPIRYARAVRLRSGVDMMKGREKRLGSQAAVIADVEMPCGMLTAVSVHLDAQSSQRHRAEQMRTILDALNPAGPVILGGDWNTSTYDSSHALYAIVGFWRRVMMGVDHVIRNHYLHPERWFERGLFRLLEARGFDYLAANAMGERTTYYALEDLRAVAGLAEWVPGWCFPFIRWSLRKHEERCPFKLDWFATRGLAAENPVVLHQYRHLADHDPLGVDIRQP
jgi:endonuclease/exonuclease/phosphatase family metal-dependent hydrolase